MIKPTHIFARARPANHGVRHSNALLGTAPPRRYASKARLDDVLRQRLGARTQDVPPYPPRPPPPPPPHPTKHHFAPFSRSATGATTLGAAFGIACLANDDDDDEPDDRGEVTAHENGRKDIGTFDGRGAWLEDSTAPSFTYTFKGGKFGIGGEKTSVHALKIEDETEAFLKAKQKSTEITRAGNPVIRIDENCLPCPGEDRHAVDVVSRADLAGLLAPRNGCLSIWDDWTKMKQDLDEAGGGEDDLVFVSVFDGHMSSAATSELLAKTMHPCVAWMIAAAERDASQSALGSSEVFGKAMHDAYLAWNADVMHAPLYALNNMIRMPGLPDYPDFPNPSLVVLAEAAARGSAAITAVVDVQRNMVHVANLGNSRAVAGWWNPHTETWRCEVLTEDHNPENEEEAARVRSTHPPEEAQDVVCDEGYWKRILGTGLPSRAMGNSAYKLAPQDQARLVDSLGVPPVKHNRPCLTPPYKSSEPEITSRQIHPPSGEELRFIVLASDGLWDRTTSEEAALLLSAHASGTPTTPRPDVPKTLLPQMHVYLPPPDDRKFPAEDLPGSAERSEGSWVFQDDNAATHLIRNTLGGRGWDEDVRRKVLSMQSGGTRVARDDVTAVVMWFGQRDE